MASKVLVKIPVAPFGHVNKGKNNDVGPELIAVGRTVDGIGPSKCTDPVLRVAQLEQNIRFLQEQHQQMLQGLHQEIDSLRQRNRDLQFQLVFSKGYVASSSTPSSPEDDAKNRVLSPKQVNVTPLQIELLERELGELKIQFQEVNTRNVYLTGIIDEQKKKLERFEREQQDPKPQQQQQPSPTDHELVSKLDDVEALVRKLRRENDDLRREMGELRAVSNGHQQNQQHQQQNQQQQHQQNQQQPHQHQNRGRHRGNNHYRGHRFPPVHSQSYWLGGRGAEKDGEGSSGTSLPSLNVNHQHQQHQQHPQQTNGHGGHYNNGRRTGNNNHHYHQGGGDGRKYRGGQKQGPKTS